MVYFYYYTIRQHSTQIPINLIASYVHVHIILSLYVTSYSKELEQKSIGPTTVREQ